MLLRNKEFLPLIMLILAHVGNICFAQSIQLHTQTEVNAFDPGLTVINGYLFISDTSFTDPITNLSPLAGLQEVTGDVTITYCSVTDLQGLGALSKVGKSFRIQNNDLLESVDNLTSLTEVGESLEIANNDLLALLLGPQVLTTIGKDLILQYNSLLQQVDGFNQLTKISGDISIMDNDVLTTINGFNALITADGGLLLNNNSELTSINGFQSLIEAKGDLTLQYCKVSNLDFLENIESVGGLLEVKSTKVTEIPDLPNLQYVGRLTVSYNELLTDIAGFNGLLSIGNSFYIFSNSITQITGLRNLRTVRVLTIGSNNLLTDIYGFTALESVKEITFNSNPVLTNFEGFVHLKEVETKFHIYLMDSLTDVDDFQALTRAGYVNISGCENLKNLDGFANLISLTHLTVEVCERLERIRLPKIKRVESWFRVSSCPILKTLDFPELDSIGNKFTIYNTGLEDVNGFSKLEYVNFSMDIEENDFLIQLNGFRNMRYVGGSLTVWRNPLLSDCCGISYLLSTPGAIGGGNSIGQNNTGCDSKMEVLAHGNCANVINDIDRNCVWTADEPKLAGRFAFLSPGNIFLTSDAIGRFDLSNLLAGQYNIQIDTSGPWTTQCDITRTFLVAQDGELPEFDPFTLYTTEPCMYPSLSVEMPFARPCFGNQQIIVQACNDILATGAIENGFIDLTLDSLLTFQSASHPSIHLTQHVYRFNLEDLSPGECVTIKIIAMVSCDAVLGQTLCLQAEISPADTCIYYNEEHTLTAPNPGCVSPYEGSDIEVTGHCDSDSVYFSIKNLSDHATQCFVPLRLFRDENLVWKDSILLNSHSVHTLTFVADGRTIRLEADQHPDHPYLSRPNVSIERCGDLAKWVPGIINSFYQDDLSPVIDITCIEVTGSFDPNDKSASPRGIGDLHHIRPNEPLDYRIRFQNTGTDTAFTIVIRDTLDAGLDIFSTKPGASSHPYKFSMHGPRVLEWEFENILLPDSNKNEAGSHGFVTFQVKQLPNLEEGTVLKNRAGIYFDFNDPVYTNDVSHVIHIPQDLISSVSPDEIVSGYGGRIIPNPSDGNMDLVFHEMQDEIVIQTFSCTGQLIEKDSYTHTNSIRLPTISQPGLYFIHVLLPGKRSYVLKAIVN